MFFWMVIFVDSNFFFNWHTTLKIELRQTNSKINHASNVAVSLRAVILRAIIFSKSKQNTTSVEPTKKVTAGIDSFPIKKLSNHRFLFKVTTDNMSRKNSVCCGYFI